MIEKHEIGLRNIHVSSALSNTVVRMGGWKTQHPIVLERHLQEFGEHGTK